MSGGFWSTPRRWPGETFVIIASGPSLTPEDVDYCRGKARVIAINVCVELAMWADVHYYCDNRWREWMIADGKWPDFKGLRVTLEKSGNVVSPDHTLHNGGTEGLDPRPTHLRTGRNSGFQAMNLAVHFGAKKIVLLGYDMKPASDKRVHWHPEHKTPTKPTVFATAMLPIFPTIVKPLKKLGIEVINATRDSDLRVFPMKQLEEVL